MCEHGKIVNKKDTIVWKYEYSQELVAEYKKLFELKKKLKFKFANIISLDLMKRY